MENKELGTVNGKEINLEALTIDDCMSAFILKGIRVQIENGKVTKMVEEGK